MTDPTTDPRRTLLWHAITKHLAVWGIWAVVLLCTASGLSMTTWCVVSTVFMFLYCVQCEVTEIMADAATRALDGWAGSAALGEQYVQWCQEAHGVVSSPDTPETLN